MKLSFIKRLASQSGLWLTTTLVLCPLSQAWSDHLPEYRLKAAFLYNFTTFTEWPTGVGETLNLCVYGKDPFGGSLDELQGAMVGSRGLAVRRENDPERLEDCQIVFIARSAYDDLQRVLNQLNGKPVLTVADTPGAARQGIAINMRIQQKRVTFEANLAAARGHGLNLSSRLLNLATEVIR